MNNSEAIAFCKQWLPTWTGNKPDLLIDIYAETAFYSDPANKGGLKGRAQILPYFKKLLAANPNWAWEVVEVFPTEHGFTMKWKATIPIGPEVVTEYGMDLVEVTQGKITRNEVYFDRSALLDALRKIKHGK